MAYVLQHGGVGSLAYPFYVGFAGDVKPTPDDENVTLYELDTGRRFTWREKQWYLLSGPAAAVKTDEKLDQILLELRKIRVAHELILGTQLSGEETER